MDIAPCGIVTQPPTNEKNLKTISQGGLCIFNDGTDTYLHPGNGSYSAIDLTVTDPSLLLDFSWKVHDLCGSDHFPIIIESLHATVGERLTRYKFDKADWILYEQMCREKIFKQK